MFAFFGCATGNNYALVPQNKSFRLTEDYEFSVEGRFRDRTYRLPRGVYRCYFSDPEGEYFEAPSTMREGFSIGSVSKGGIYLTYGEDRQAFLYIQDNTINTAYVYGVGILQNGGSGKFDQSVQLPDDFLQRIEIKSDE